MNEYSAVGPAAPYFVPRVVIRSPRSHMLNLYTTAGWRIQTIRVICLILQQRLWPEGLNP